MKTLILFLCFFSNLVYAQGFEKGFIALKSKNYQIAESTFRSCEKKHPSAAAYGLASLYLTNDFKDKDSAYRYVLLAEKKWPSFDKKNREKALFYGFDSLSIQQLKLKVSSLFYAICESSNLATDYQKFIIEHPWSPYCLPATHKRDSLLFENTKIVGTSSAVYDFIVSNPESYLVPIAKDLFDDLQYSESTVSETILDYTLFVENFPFNKNVSKAEDQIYVISVAEKSINAYKNFLLTFPNNPNFNKGWIELYNLYTKDCRLENFKNFEKEFPAFPFKQVLKNDLIIFNHMYYPFSENNLFGYIDSSGFVMIPAIYDDVSFFQDGIAIVTKNGKSGLINKRNELIVGFDFDEIYEFNNDFAIVMVSDSFGVINRIGSFVFPLIYRDILMLNNELIAAKNEIGFSIYDLDRNEKSEILYQDIKQFDVNHFIVQVGDSIGLLNSSLELKIPIIYEAIAPIKDSIFSYQLDGKKGLISASGRIISPAVYDDFSNYNEHSKTIIAKFGLKIYYLNLDGTKFISSAFDYFPKALDIAHFYEGNAIFFKNRKFGIINAQGNVILKPTFTALGKVSEFIPVTKAGKWGFMNTKGKMILEYKFTAIESFYDLGFIVELDSFIGLLGNDLQPLTSMNHQSIKRIGNNHLLAMIDGKYGIYSISGEQVIPFAFDLIQLNDADCLTLINEKGISYFFLNSSKYLIKQ